MHKQIVVNVMGSPLGSTLDIIFVGYYQKEQFWRTSKPVLYSHYVDGTFAIFKEESNYGSFLTALNFLLRRLTFTVKNESNDKLPSLELVAES